MNIITKAQKEELTARIEPLLEQVELWRKNKTSNEAMPEPLWEAAVALAKVYGVSPVQGILRIDYVVWNGERVHRVPKSKGTLFGSLHAPFSSRARISHPSTYTGSPSAG